MKAVVLKAVVARLRAATDSDVADAARRSPAAMTAALVLLTLCAVALCADWIAPFGPVDGATPSAANALTPPLTLDPITGERFWLGTDALGRDMLSTTLYGLRISVFVALTAALVAVTLGVGLGLLAGSVGGWIDAAAMWVADMQTSFPSIMIAMLIFAAANGLIPHDARGESAIWALTLAISLSAWPPYARAVRDAATREMGKSYIAAARLAKRSGVAIMVWHVLPNVVRPALSLAAASLSLALIAETTLSYLGVGAPPTQPSLGALIRLGQDYLFTGEWWILAVPAATLLALASSATVLGYWLGERLRDATPPRPR